MPKFQHVLLKAEEMNLKVECMLGEGTPQVIDGYAGWEVVDRPKRRGLTYWKGSNPVRLEVPILFDDFADRPFRNRSVEKECRKLEKMAGLIRDGIEPPLLTIHSGGVIPHDYRDSPQNEWVIETLDWGEAIRSRNGDRIRQAGIITFLLYVDADSLRRLGQRLERARKGTKIYVVKRGDKSLREIARKRLGSGDKWRQIGNLNGIRDPKNIFEGQRLRIPKKKKKKN